MELIATAVVTAPPGGGVHLGRYPGLAHKPEVAADGGVVFAHNGKELGEMVRVAIPPEVLSAGIVNALDHVAKALGVPFGDVCDAVKYLRDQKRI